MFTTLSPHELLVFLLQTGGLLGLALLLGRLAVLLGMPAVAGELCAGVVLGPSLLGHVTGLRGLLLPGTPAQSHLIDAVGQIGVLLLVGLSGAQVDFRLVRRESRTVLGIGMSGLLFPFALGVAAGFLLPATLIGAAGDRSTFAFFLGVAMAVSAIPVIAKILLDMGLLHRDVGQLTLAASLVDDAAGWLGLAVVSAFVTMRAGHRTGHIVLALASLAGIVVFVLAARPLARLILGRLRRSDNPAIHAATVVTLILLAAAGAGGLGLEPVTGAFACGVVLSSAGNFERERLAGLQTVVLGVLAPVFFATAGLRMNLGTLRSPAVLASAGALLLVATAGKFGGAYAGARLSKVGRREAIAIAAGLNSRGVIQIVIATVGYRIGVLTTSSYTLIVLVAIGTSMMAAPAMRAAMRPITQTEEEDRRAESLIIHV